MYTYLVWWSSDEHEHEHEQAGSKSWQPELAVWLERLIRAGAGGVQLLLTTGYTYEPVNKLIIHIILTHSYLPPQILPHSSRHYHHIIWNRTIQKITRNYLKVSSDKTRWMKIWRIVIQGRIYINWKWL